MKKKVLFIIPYLIGGGALKTVSNLSKEFLGKYDVTIIGIFGSEEKYEFSGNLIELNMRHQKNPFKKLIDFLKIRNTIKKIKEENAFDFSISFLVIADFLNVMTKTKNKEKTIVSIRNIESIEYKDKFYRRLQIRIATKKADHVVSISREVQQDLIENFNVDSSKITTIYNPCIVDNVCKNKIDKTIFSFGKTVVTLGGLKYQKGQWHLIRAFSYVAKVEPEAKLLIFGRGEYEDYLRGLIKGLRLEKNVLLMGYVLGPYEYVKAADLFVFPSLFEGLGNSLMEALKCKVPIISTDYVSGAREILAPNSDFRIKATNVDYAEYGILVPNFDGVRYNFNDPLTREEKIMAKAIICLLRDEKLKERYRNLAEKRAKDFDISTVASEWYTLFDKMAVQDGRKKK